MFDIFIGAAAAGVVAALGLLPLLVVGYFVVVAGVPLAIIVFKLAVVVAFFALIWALVSGARHFALHIWAFMFGRRVVRGANGWRLAAGDGDLACASFAAKCANWVFYAPVFALVACAGVDLDGRAGAGELVFFALCVLCALVTLGAGWANTLEFFASFEWGKSNKGREIFSIR